MDRIRSEGEPGGTRGKAFMFGTWGGQTQIVMCTCSAEAVNVSVERGDLNMKEDSAGDWVGWWQMIGC